MCVYVYLFIPTRDDSYCLYSSNRTCSMVYFISVRRRTLYVGPYYSLHVVYIGMVIILFVIYYYSNMILYIEWYTIRSYSICI